MQPDDHRQRIAERERGVLARQIFDNPLWDEAYTRLVNDLMQQLLDPKLDFSDTMDVKKQILALHRIKQDFENILATGQMANQQLNEARDAAANRNRTTAARG